MKKSVQLGVVLIVLSFCAWAQENKYEVTVQGSGFFPGGTSKGSLTTKPTASGGVMAGFRANVTNRFAIEGDYDYFRNDQKFVLSGGMTRIPINVHSVTAVAVVKLPSWREFKPFALAGGGVMVFDPRNAENGNSQSRGTFVYGGGFDLPVPMTKHVAFRAQYRGFVYKDPDFDSGTLKTAKYTHAAVPSAGLVLTF